MASSCCSTCPARRSTSYSICLSDCSSFLVNACTATGSARLISYRLTILGGLEAEYFVLALLGLLGPQVAFDALGLARATSLVFFFLQLVHRLVDVPFQVVRDFCGQDKDSITMSDNSLVLGVGVNIWILIVSGTSETVETQGDTFVFKQGQKQMLKVFPLLGLI